MGGIAFRNVNFDLAQSYYERSFEIFKSLEDKEQYYHSMYHLGMIALEKGQYKKAIQLFQDSLDGSGKINWIDLEADSKYGISLLKEKTKEFDQALEFALEALKIYERLGKQRQIRKTLTLIERLKNLL
jgi:tetratricopeptide (TPR) repeat protein